jgi:hypothetical protein
MPAGGSALHEDGGNRNLKQVPNTAPCEVWATTMRGAPYLGCHANVGSEKAKRSNSLQLTPEHRGTLTGREPQSTLSRFIYYLECVI